MLLREGCDRVLKPWCHDYILRTGLKSIKKIIWSVSAGRSECGVQYRLEKKLVEFERIRVMGFPCCIVSKKIQ